MVTRWVLGAGATFVLLVAPGAVAQPETGVFAGEMSNSAGLDFERNTVQFTLGATDSSGTLDYLAHSQSDNSMCYGVQAQWQGQAYEVGASITEVQASGVYLLGPCGNETKEPTRFSTSLRFGEEILTGTVYALDGPHQGTVGGFQIPRTGAAPGGGGGGAGGGATHGGVAPSAAASGDDDSSGVGVLPVAAAGAAVVAAGAYYVRGRGPRLATAGTAPAPSAPSAPSGPPVTAGAWAPTHTVPSAGLPAYSAADIGPGPVAQLDPSLPVQVDSWHGDWAHVTCENGWECWVDGRHLTTG